MRLVGGDPSRGNLELAFSGDKQISVKKKRWDNINERDKLLKPGVLTLACNPGPQEPETGASGVKGILRYTVQRPAWGT